MPFGRVGAGEFGTYFIGYTATPDVIEQMLTNMFVGNPPGNHDRLLDFSTALTGTLFFVPAGGFVDDPPQAATSSVTAEPAVDDPAEHPPDPDDGSLGDRQPERKPRHEPTASPGSLSQPPHPVAVAIARQSASIVVRFARPGRRTR